MPLFAFLDESGNYQFTRDHPNYIVYAAVITTTPSLFCQDFSELKYELHAQGNCQDRFHACEDTQAVRNRVFEIVSRSTGYAVHSVVVKKICGKSGSAQVRRLLDCISDLAPIFGRTSEHRPRVHRCGYRSRSVTTGDTESHAKGPCRSRDECPSNPLQHRPSHFACAHPTPSCGLLCLGDLPQVGEQRHAFLRAHTGKN